MDSTPADATMRSWRNHASLRAQHDLEHTEGPAFTVLLPYPEKRFGRSIDYGQLHAAAGIRHVWL